MTTPDFSVLMRTTGRGQEVANALASVAAQTLDPERFEVVLVNDGGPSVADVAVDAGTGINVRLVEHQVRRGKSAAINSAFEASTGRYLCILDDDDLYYPSHLEVLLEAVGQDPAAAVLYTDTDVAVDEDGVRRIIGNQAWEYDQSELVMMQKAPIACSMCIRRQAWADAGGFDVQFSLVLDDWEFYMRLSQQNAFRHIPVTTTRYTQPPARKTFERFEAFEAGLAVIREKLGGHSSSLRIELALDTAAGRLRRDHTIATRDFQIEELRAQLGSRPQDAPLVDARMGASLVDPIGSTSVQASSVKLFTVELENRGADPWCSNGGRLPVHLAYHWTYPDGEPAIWDGVRTPLPRDVAPGDRIRARILVVCPSRAGDYAWIPAVVQEGVDWLAEDLAGAGPARLAVRVLG
jgi:glycosyltransferase involved in cell wall biosynthesis